MDRVEHRPGRQFDCILISEQRDPARQEGVLHTRNRGVAVVHVFQGTTAAGSRNRSLWSGDDEHLAIEGPGALQFLQQQVRLTTQRGFAVQPTYTRIGSTAPPPLNSSICSTVGPVATKSRPLRPARPIRPTTPVPGTKRRCGLNHTFGGR